jgi:signal transduction histidine kinase
VITHRGGYFPVVRRLTLGAFVVFGGGPGPAVFGAVTIDAVTVDGHEVALDAPGPSGSRKPLRIPSTAQRLEVHFSGEADPRSPPAADESAPASPRGTRLRYRLEGLETGWRDPPASGRVVLGFKDRERGEVAIVDQVLAGESPGWHGAAEESVFLRQSLEATAPANAIGTSINVLSIHAGEAVGVIAIDDLVVTIERATTGEVERHPLPVDLGDQPFDPMRRPKNWDVSGIRRLASQLRLRASPQPHPILVLVDDEPDRYGGWIAKTGVRVQQGDRVRVTWAAAWSIGAAREATAEYRDLKPGTYFFHAGAFFPSGIPTGTEVILPIEVYLPWHRRRDVWAASFGLVFVGAVLAARAANVRRIERRLERMEHEHALEQERARIARDLHDDVGAGLAEIAMQTRWIRGEIEHGDSREAIDLTEAVRRSADDLVRSIDAIVWAVNPANDTLERFAVYVVQSTERFLEAAGLSMRFDIPDPLPPVALDGAARHRLFLALREAVHNAVQHAGASSVTVSMKLHDGRLEMVVADDGRGFDTAAVPDSGTHDGIGNMRKRMEELGGECSISRSAVGGTRVCLITPLERRVFEG